MNVGSTFAKKKLDGDMGNDTAQVASKFRGNGGEAAGLTTYCEIYWAELTERNNYGGRKE